MEFNDPFTPDKHSSNNNNIISQNGGMPLIYGSNVTLESPDVTSKFHSSKSSYNNQMVKKNNSNNLWKDNDINDSSNNFISPTKNKKSKSYANCTSPISSNYNSNTTPSTPISSTPKNIPSTPETPITPYMMTSQTISDDDDNEMESWEYRSSPLRTTIISSPAKEQWNCAKPQSFSPQFNDVDNYEMNNTQKNSLMNSSITHGNKDKTININSIKTEKIESTMPLVNGANVTMASPDVSSKFYEGTKYVAIPANINNNVNNRSFKNSKNIFSFNNSQSLIDNSLSNDKLEKLKSKSSFNNAKEVFNNNLISSQQSMPLIGGSNVTMESPDVTSKFYEGNRDYASNTQTTPIIMEQYPIQHRNDNSDTPTSDYQEGQSFSTFSPLMSPAGESHLETWNQLQSFSPCPFNNHSNENSAKKSMPLIFGSNVSVDSPDVSSKFHDNKLIHHNNSLQNVPNFYISDENSHPIIKNTNQNNNNNKGIRTGGFNNLTSKNAINDARNICKNSNEFYDENASKSFNLNKLLTNMKEKTIPRIVLSDISNLQNIDQQKESMNDKDMLINQIHIPTNNNNKVNIQIHQISPTSISDIIYSPDGNHPNQPDYKSSMDKSNKKELRSLSAWSPSQEKENKINNLTSLSTKEYNRADLSSQFQIELDSKIDDVVIPLIPLKPSKPLVKNDSRSKLERNPLSNSRKFIQPMDSITNENKENNTSNENNMGNIIIHIPTVPSAPIGTPRAPLSTIPASTGDGNGRTFRRSPKNYVSPSAGNNKMIVHNNNIDILDIIEKVEQTHKPYPPPSKLTINDEISIENKIKTINDDVNIEEIIDFAQKKIENVIPENNTVNIMKFDNFHEEVVVFSNSDDFEICNNNEDLNKITSDNMNMNRNISSPPTTIRELIGFKSPLKSPPKFVQELIVYPEDVNKSCTIDSTSPREEDIKISNNQPSKRTRPTRRRYKRRVFDPSLLESVPEDEEIEFDIPNWLQLHNIGTIAKSKKVFKSKPKKDIVDSNYTIWLRGQISNSAFSNSILLEKYPWLPNLYECINETNLTGLKEVENVWLTYLNDLSSVELIDDNHNTPLMIASWIGCRRVVKYLLRRGCDINAQNINGNTPLHFASECHHSPVVEYLLKKGANDALKNSMDMNHFGR
jgi:hypothetical protein